MRADNVVVLSDMMVTRGFNGDESYEFSTVIKQYLKEVNSLCKFFFMDISGYG